MSRIQQILDKAARDGVARRTHVPAPDDAAAAPPEPEVRRRPSRLASTESAPRQDALPDVHAEPLREPTVVEAAPLSRLLVAATAPHAMVAEQYRALRTRLAFSESGRPRRVLLVSSPASGDGKSLTAANLALTMAQEFTRRVVLVDADLRRPSLHRLFGLPQEPGLADVLLGRAALEDVLVSLPEHHLTLVPAGSVPESPAELLGSVAMRRVLDTLRSRFDRVLIDSPPALPLADVGVLAPITDGLLMVVRAGVTPRPQIERALGVCDSSHIVGLVLNDTGSRESGYAASYGRAVTA